MFDVWIGPWLCGLTTFRNSTAYLRSLIRVDTQDARYSPATYNTRVRKHQSLFSYPRSLVLCVHPFRGILHGHILALPPFLRTMQHDPRQHQAQDHLQHRDACQYPETELERGYVRSHDCVSVHRVARDDYRVVDVVRDIRRADERC